MRLSQNSAMTDLTLASLIEPAVKRPKAVSTTHVRSSGVAGAVAANGSELQMSTLRNSAMVWVLPPRRP